MNKTITISIGNSDDKLTQVEWSEFVSDVDYELSNIHFFGGSPTHALYQTVTWVIEIEEEYIERLKRSLTTIRKRYNQDSIAWTEGNTLFI